MKPVGLIPEARPWWVIAREESQADSTPGAREGGKEGDTEGPFEGLVLCNLSSP